MSGVEGHITSTGSEPRASDTRVVNKLGISLSRICIPTYAASSANFSKIIVWSNVCQLVKKFSKFYMIKMFSAEFTKTLT